MAEQSKDVEGKNIADLQKSILEIVERYWDGVDLKALKITIQTAARRAPEGDGQWVDLVEIHRRRGNVSLPRMEGGEASVKQEVLRQEAPETLQRARRMTRWGIFVIIGTGLIAAAAGVVLFRGKGEDPREDARPATKAHADSLPSPPVSRGAGVVEGEVGGVREKVEAALDAVQGPPDTLEVGGEVGTLEKLPENCFWGRLSKSKCILALTYRTVVAPDGTEVMQKLVFVFSPDCRSCFVLNPKPKQPPSEETPFSGGIYFSNDGEESFTHTPFPQTLTETTYLETHANPELQDLLLKPALSGSKEGEYGETIEGLHLPTSFYGLPREDVLEMMGISPATAERLQEVCAEHLMWICAAEQRKAQAAAERRK